MAGVETYLVRVWVPAEAEAEPVGLRGLLEDVRTGRSVAFAGGEELLALLEQASGRRAGGAVGGAERGEQQEGAVDEHRTENSS